MIWWEGSNGVEVGSRGGGERAERQRWDGMCEWGDDRWGPVAGCGLGEIVLPQIARRTPSGYTTIGNEEKGN